MTISLPTDAVNFGAYLQPFPNYPGVLGENIRWFAANGVTGVYMVTMPGAFSSLCARCCSHGFSTSESIHHLILELLMNRILNFRMSMMAWILKSEILILFKQEGEPTNRGEIYSDLEELKNYVMAQMLWDPTQDPQRLSADFLRFYCERSLAVPTSGFCTV